MMEPIARQRSPAPRDATRRTWLCRAAATAGGAATAVLALAAPAGALGSLDVGSVGTSSLSGTVAGTLVGTLPSATWSDTTATGAGWNGTVALSDLVFTGTWAPLNGATALSNAASSAYTSTADGISYTVTTGALTAGAGSFTYTSNDAGDASGSGTAVGGLNANVGTHGLTINFGLQTLASGLKYQIKAGTQSASAASLNTAASGAAITANVGTTSPNPVFVNNGLTVTGGGAGATAYGTPVKFVSAAVNTGEGSYTVVPGVKIVTDPTSWVGTYTAGVSYTIASGP